jgi:hypothetical protein
MSVPRLLLALAGIVALAPASALAAHSTGTPEQVAWVRRAATNFLSAELAGNGAGACGILIAPLRATQHHRSCVARWNAKLTRLLQQPGERARLQAQRHAIASDAVIVHANNAWLHLPSPLISGPNQFVWSETAGCSEAERRYGVNLIVMTSPSAIT